VHPAQPQARRIAVIARNFPAVSETFVLDHVAGLLGRGHEVRVFCRHPGDSGPTHADYASHRLDALTTTWMPTGSRLDRWVRTLAGALSLGPRPAARVLASPKRVDLSTLATHLGRWQPPPQLLHAHFGAQGEFVAVLKAAQALKQPLIVSLHGYDVTRVAAGTSPPYRHLFAQAQRLVVTSRFMARTAEALGCPATKLVRIPIGIRIERFTWAARRAPAGRPLQLLSVARLVEQKGLERGIRAVADLARSGLALRYVIVGDGPLRAKLRTVAAECGIADQVEFAGAQTREQLLAHYAQSDLFLFPCTKVRAGDEEGQGIVLQEAQASGLPVIATRHGGVAESVDEDASALITEDDDLAFARGLRELVGGADRWPAMGEAGRAHVQRHFRFDQFIAATEALYDDVLGPTHG
jgi:colanic acid/amylovoran biosynthesis glycosyltransferase